ncbi:MAG: universal stress protein [Pseudomonadota bacterium]
MNIQSILVVTDLSVRGHRALGRAALLAAQHRAFLRVMYARVDDSPFPADAMERVVQLAQQLAQQFGIAVSPVGRAGNTLKDIAAQARGADLLVFGHERKHSLAAILSGPPEIQLMRLCPCPILVARLEPGQRYGRILVAVNLAPESKSLVQLACLLDDDAEVGLFHALSMAGEAKLRSAEASAHAIQSYRQACIRYAQGRILSLADSLDNRRNRVMYTMGRGDPARQAVIQQQHAGAELLVVGNRRRSRLMDFLAGSVAQRVLSWSASDLLLVAHDFQLPTRAAAKLRMDAGRADGQEALLAIRSAP